MSVSPRKPKLYHPTRPLKLWQDSSHDQGETRIEIIPLIDVIFCILTFFILGAVGLSRQQAISLDLPRASTGSAQMREMFMVSLDDLGQLYVEKQPVTEPELFNALKNYHQYNPNGLIVLNASRNSSYNDVIQLLDLLRQVGGDQVSLATLPGDPQTPHSFNDPTLGLPGSSLPSGYGAPTQNNPPAGLVPTVPSAPLPRNPPAPNLPGLTPPAPDRLPPR